MASPAGNRVTVLVLTFTLISGITVFFRLFTRLAVIRNAGFEDACVAVAMVCTLKCGSISIRTDADLLILGFLDRSRGGNCYPSATWHGTTYLRPISK